MDSYEIIGGQRLEGEMTLSGAKNAVLPIMAATIVTGKVSRLNHCPDLSDVRNMAAILRQLGCKVKTEHNCIEVDAKTIDSDTLSARLTREMRSSIFLMGPMIARTGKVILTHPGGCEIGERPIDIHIKALEQLGVEIKEKEGVLECTANQLQGGNICLSFPSVGATENAMMAAVCANGQTVITNAAREPEIVDLQNFLNQAGACIRGAGTKEIVVCGTKEFFDTEHRVIADRIEGGTYLAAVAVTGGELFLNHADASAMRMTLAKLREAGCQIKEGVQQIYLKAPKRLNAVELIKTAPHPGFPTDMQSQILAVLTVADGVSHIEETIFESRFKYTEQLKKMGARIVVCGKTAAITGVDELKGTTVLAEDLRGGAALVLAGLTANGKTKVENICHIDRGYDKFDLTLKKLGAKIERISE